MEVNQLLASSAVKWVFCLDFETTCQTDFSQVAPDKVSSLWEAEEVDREVVEIGALLAPKDYHGIYARVSTFVCPNPPRVTPFSLKLCPHITLDKLSAAPPWSQAYGAMLTKIANCINKVNMPGEDLSSVAFLQWGEFDWKMLKKECSRHNCALPAFAGKVNVKKWFEKVHGELAVPAGSGIESALKKLGLTFQGTPHTAYADALNTWRLYRALRVQGKI